MTDQEVKMAFKAMCYQDLHNGVWYKAFGFMYYIFIEDQQEWRAVYLPAHQSASGGDRWERMDSHSTADYKDIRQLIHNIQEWEHYGHRVGSGCRGVNWLEVTSLDL